jgi:hypothetical protein
MKKENPFLYEKFEKEISLKTDCIDSQVTLKLDQSLTKISDNEKF